jgi:iron(III) transport system permease protein
LWLAFLLICYAPVGTVLLGGPGDHGPSIEASPIWNLRRMGLLGSSLLLAVMVATVAMALAAPLAAILWRAPQRIARWARWILFSWIVVPPCVQAMAWLGIWRWGNGALAMSGLSALPLTGWFAAGALQALTFFPLAVALAWLGFESVDREWLEAARMHRDERTVLLRIALPLAAPGLLAGGGLVCLLSLLDFSLPSLCGVTVYTLDLFAEYSSNGNARHALLSALPLMLACTLIIWLSQGVFRNVASRTAGLQTDCDPNGRTFGTTGVPTVAKATDRFRLLPYVALLMLLLLPLVALCVMTTGGAGIATAWMAARSESWNSLRTALLTALLAVLPALAVAETLATNGWRSRAAWLVVTLPLAIPPPLVGIGWAVLATRIGSPLQGSSWLPILAALARFLPIAALVLLVARRRLDPLLWDAARIFQTHPWQGFRRVRLPLLRRGLIAAAALTAALTLGELGATLIVVPPGELTLTLRLYNFLHYGASAHVAALGLLLALLAAFAGAAVGWLLDGPRRTSAFPG